MIDPHVHCRDWDQKYKETIAHALDVAERAGISGIFDMPNTCPQMTSRQLVERRLADADKVGSPVFYGLYMGLTSSPSQVCSAVWTWRELFPRVVGLKMFAGESVGNLGITNLDEQRLVYETLAGEGYDGVLAVHCERKDLMKTSLWNPSDPKSHSFVRTIEAEVQAVKDQIEFARRYKFNGVLHIAHVSVPESVELIEGARKRGGINISCGLTPHHCCLNYESMPNSQEGLLFKVNPPLRDRNSAETMLQLLKDGKINWIETDHAPHTLAEKLGNPYMSGFPGLPFYPHFIKYLGAQGFSEGQVRQLTHNNILNTFGFKIRELEREPDLNLHGEYEVDVYAGRRK
jgi:dihydroorotase